jgi:hypothetical protein
MLCADQVLPFQYSAVAAPTASQLLDEVHDTAVRPLPDTVWVAQVLPFQYSASEPALLPTASLPTASQSLAETHETPVSSDPAGLGAVCSAQVLPFQRSATVPEASVSPTASQLLAAVQETR